MKLKILFGLLFIGVSTQAIQALLLDKTSMAAGHHKKGKLIDRSLPVVFQADQMDYDDKKEIVWATGNVYLSQGPNLLRADRVEYHKKQDKVIASGSVWLKDEDGNYSFFEYAELSDQMKNGLVEHLKVLMTDDSRASGNKGKRYAGEKIILWQGVYSPCPICKQKPGDTPLWQLKGDKIIHNKEEQTLTYNHAWFELVGVPVFYTPYFYHPDPTVKRKTGLLAPLTSSGKDLGTAATLPLFIVTGKNHDICLFPTITEKQGVILAAEHRYRLVDGDYSLRGSYANQTSTHKRNAQGREVKKNLPNRWHVFFDGRYEFNDETLAKIEVRRASDLPYVKRFPVLYGSKTKISDVQGALRSTASLENFRQTSYGIIQGYVFQTEDQDFTPVILPIASYNYETMPGTLFNSHETFYMDANFLNLFREKDRAGLGAKSMVRGSLDLGGQIPYVSPWGDIWQLKTSVRGDVYNINHYRKTVFTPKNEAKSYGKERIYPLASLTWRYPFINCFQKSQWIIEPAAMVLTSSQGGNGLAIPNEDSPIVIVEQTNLFSPNRFYGIDRIDNGSRFVYGVHNKHYFSKGRKFFLFFGQSIRLDHKRVLPRSSGEDRNASNFIVGITLAPFSWIEGKSRLMLNRKNSTVEVAETSALLKTKWGTANFSHVYYTPKVQIPATPPFQNRAVSQANWGVSTLPYKQFTLTYSESFNMTKADRSIHTHRRPPRLLKRAITIEHHHECVRTTLSVIRSGFRDKDLKPDTKVMLQFYLKNIGNVAPIQILGSGGLYDPTNRRKESEDKSVIG